MLKVINLYAFWVGGNLCYYFFYKKGCKHDMSGTIHWIPDMVYYIIANSVLMHLIVYKGN